MIFKRFFGLVVGVMGSVSIFAQTYPGKYTWEEFDKRLKASEKVAVLGPNFAGDNVSLSNGALSFSVADVSLPGSNSLKVEFSRSYSVFSRKDYGDLGMLGDWIVDVPSVSGVFAPDWLVGISNSSARCTDGSVPRVDTPYGPSDFWQGVELSIPGAASSELLRTLPGVTKPSDGKTYYWLTNDRVHVSCLDTIKNGVGQGFLAITSDGTKYWFDWMAQTPEPVSLQIRHVSDFFVHDELVRKKNYLYATRVEDRFGNSVSYTYSNAWNAPGKLTKIESSDGRRLDVTYDGATVSTVSDGKRSWEYAYGTTPSGRKTLSSVKLPDQSAWTIAFSSFTDGEIKYYDFPPAGEVMRTCMVNAVPINIAASLAGSIKHPAGATAEFTVGILEHGRSFVPINCRNVVTSLTGADRGADNNQNDDINTWATSSYSFTLTKKKTTGPGQAASEWNYGYQPNFSFYMYPGTTMQWPVCEPVGSDCSPPPCTNDSCARYSVTTLSGPGSEWRRYVYGNTYRYNEGKLLRVESGFGPENLLRSETHYYDLGTADSIYPARFGSSARLNYDGFASEYHRPEKKTEIVQQGIAFAREVTEFDSAARPVQLVRSSAVMSDPSAPNIPVPTVTAPATAVAGASHTVSWIAGAGTPTYELERKVDGGSFTNVYSGPSTSISLAYPSPATLTYRARDCNGYGTCGSYSSEKVVLVKDASMGVPVLTVPSQVGARTVFVVQWTSVPGAVQYVLERKNGAAAYAVAYTGADLSVIQKINVATTMRYRVKACDSASNCGAFSAVGMVVVKSTGDPGEP